MTRSYAELTIEDMLADPMILAMRRADRIDPCAYEHLLRTKAQALAANRPTPIAMAAVSTTSTEPPKLAAHICRQALNGLLSRSAPSCRPQGSPRAW